MSIHVENFKDATVILENKDEIAYFFMDKFVSIYLRPEDLGHSYVQIGDNEQLHQDMEDLLLLDYMSIVKGVNYVNQHITSR